MFKVGDRVEVTHPQSALIGKRGVVVAAGGATVVHVVLDEDIASGFPFTLYFENAEVGLVA